MGVAGALLWFLGKQAPREVSGQEPILIMGRDLAADFAREIAAVLGGEPEEREEMANALEAACMEGRCSITAAGGMQVQPEPARYCLPRNPTHFEPFE